MIFLKYSLHMKNTFTVYDCRSSHPDALFKVMRKRRMQRKRLVGFWKTAASKRTNNNSALLGNFRLRKTFDTACTSSWVFVLSKFYDFHFTFHNCCRHRRYNKHRTQSLLKNLFVLFCCFILFYFFFSRKPHPIIFTLDFSRARFCRFRLLKRLLQVAQPLTRL